MKNLGIVLICISAFLYGVRYLAAAIYGSNTQSWSKELYQSMLEYVGTGPLVLSWLSFSLGLIIIFFAEYKGRINNGIKEIKENWNSDETS